MIDLGHGTGKGVLAACLMHPFESCRGIEILENLQNQSVKLKKCYESFVDEMDEAKYKSLFRMEKCKAPGFNVRLGDIITDDWSDADFIIANSTCFSEGLMQAMAKSSAKCKKGSWFVTLTKRLPTADDNLVTKSGDAR